LALDDSISQIAKFIFFKLHSYVWILALEVKPSASKRVAIS